MQKCWCGSVEFAAFSPQYGQCETCGTLVSLDSLAPEELVVGDDETDFYGKQYWLNHQDQDLGFPDIYNRARYDLTERNLHWLNALLKYCLPPANVLELGCAHGSFVGLMKQAGYNASGLEMSHWVVDFGRKTFDVPIHVGPVEQTDIEAESLDAIVLMDVLEHLPDPASTLRYCSKLLKPNGLFLIQTPQFRGGMNYNNLLETDSPFLEQLKADEHLYLFTEESVKKLLADIGFTHTSFEPAIFAQYDMFFVAAKAPPHVYTNTAIDERLLATLPGRIVAALLDIRRRELDAQEKLEEANLASKERLNDVQRLASMLQNAEANRDDHISQIKTLTELLAACEADRAARLTDVQTLTARLEACEADRAARLADVQTLTARLEACEADRAARLTDVQTLTARLKASEDDRAARLAIIRKLTTQVETLERDCAARLKNIHILTERLEASEKDRAVRLENIHKLTAQLNSITHANIT